MFITKQITFPTLSFPLTSYYSPTNPNNPNIIALHGFTGSGKDFESLAQLTHERFNWYTLDLPGHDPKNLPHTQTYSLQLYLDAIHAVSQFYSLNQFILLGYSMGGRLALNYTLQHPHSIKTLILIGASPGIEDSKGRQERLKQDEKLSKWILKNDIKTFIDFWMQTPLIRSQKNMSPAIFHPIIERKYRHSPNGLSAALAALSPGKIPSLWKEIKKITCPTLIVVGEKDFQYIEIGKKMTTLLQNARYLSIPEAGHCTHLENLPVVSKDLLEFFSFK